jgi:hypothetical protein
MILLIDFDNRTNRIKAAKAAVPPHLSDRVFILGALTRPEDLKVDLGTFEAIGSALAKDCRDGRISLGSMLFCVTTQPSSNVFGLTSAIFSFDYSLVAIKSPLGQDHA